MFPQSTFWELRISLQSIEENRRILENRSLLRCYAVSYKSRTFPRETITGLFTLKMEELYSPRNISGYLPVVTTPCDISAECMTFGINTLRKLQISPNQFPPKQVQITPLSLRQNMHQHDYGKTCTQVQHAGSTIRSEGFVSLQVFEERVLIACHIGITGYKWSICLLKWKSWQNWNGSVKYYYYYYYYWTKAYSCGNDYFIGNCIWRDFYVLRTKESRA